MPMLATLVGRYAFPTGPGTAHGHGTEDLSGMDGDIELHIIDPAPGEHAVQPLSGIVLQRGRSTWLPGRRPSCDQLWNQRRQVTGRKRVMKKRRDSCGS